MKLISFLIVLAAFLIWNWLIIKKRSPNHGMQVVYRSIVWFLLALYFGHTLEEKISYFIAFHLAFWFPFDLILNLMRGLAWNYIGSTSWLDKKALTWPGAFIPGKFLLFIIGMAFIIFGVQ